MLDGLRVLDLTRLIPGPYCTLLLADYGAEVIRVEQPGTGDPMRGNAGLSGPMNPRFLYMNRGKRSVALDLKAPAGRDLLLTMARQADVLVEQFRPGVMARLGLDYAALAAVNPGIVYCSISSYGQTGPLRDRPAHDLNLLAASGLLHMSGQPEGAPVPPGGPLIDLAVGTTAAFAIMAALWERQRSGTGQYLDIAMFDLSLVWTAGYGAEYLMEGRVPQRGRTRHGGGDPRYAVYATAGDGHVSLAAREPHLWRNFCTAAGHLEWLGIGDQPGQWPQLRQQLAEFFAARSRAEWTEALAGVDTCFGPVLPMDEAFAQPQARDRGLVQAMPAPGGGETRTIGYPFRASRRAPAPLRPAPYLGADTRVVLLELGIPPERLSELAVQGVIGGVV